MLLFNPLAPFRAGKPTRHEEIDSAPEAKGWLVGPSPLGSRAQLKCPACEQGDSARTQTHELAGGHSQDSAPSLTHTQTNK